VVFLYGPKPALRVKMNEPRTFASVEEIANEIRRRLKAREGSAFGSTVGTITADTEGVVKLTDIAGGDDRTFVIGLYRRLLGLDPAEEEITAALARLRQVTRAEFAVSVQDSQEANARGAVIPELLCPSERVRLIPAAFPAALPPVDAERRVYTLNDLLRSDDLAFVVHASRCITKRDPEREALVGFLKSLEQGERSRLEIVQELAASPGAKDVGTIVLGLPRAFRHTDAPALAPIDQEKRNYSLDELLNVSSDLFIANLYRCLLKRDPDPGGGATYSANWESGKLTAADIVHAIAASPEASRQGTTVSGLGNTGLRRFLRHIPVVGRVFDIISYAISVPDLARRIVRLDREIKALARTDAHIQMHTDSLRAEVSTLLQVLDEKAGKDLMTRVAEGKVDRGELSEELGAKAARVEMLSLLAAKVDRTELTTALAKKAEASAVLQLGTDKAYLEQIEVLASMKADRSDVTASLAAKVDIDEFAKWDARKVEAGDVERVAASTVTNVLAGHRQETLAALHSQKIRILDLERRLRLVLEETRKRLPQPIADQDVAAIVGRLKGIDAAVYSEFEEVFRGTREDIKRRQAVYLSYLNNLPNENRRPVLDVGCGRGEFLELLRENGYAAVGVDESSVMVQRCHELGLHAEQGDAIECLRAKGSGEFSAIASFHVVEHLPYERLITLLDEALRVLSPGGILILETPNPQNLKVATCNFYLDPTHVRPIPPALLRFLVEERGFVNAEIKLLHPVPDYARPESGPLPGVLEELLYGPQDYGVIASKA
jgi:SAM-dependent methyltransferase